MRILLAVTCLVAVLGLACGGGDSEEDRVEALVRSYIEHYADSEPEAMYALLDAVSKQNCSEENYVEFITRTRDALGDSEIEVAEVREVVITGDEATAIIGIEVDGEPDPTQISFIKEASDWKLKLPSVTC